MVLVGRDLDGSNLVIGRAKHEGDILPAKVKPEHGVAYVAHGGREHMKHDFEVTFLNGIMKLPKIYNLLLYQKRALYYKN